MAVGRTQPVQQDVQQDRSAEEEQQEEQTAKKSESDWSREDVQRKEVTESAAKQAADWTREDVQLWLQDNDLSQLCEKFSNFNGKHLRKLYNKCMKDEDKFEDALKSDYELNASCCTQFIVALEDIFQE